MGSAVPTSHRLASLATPASSVAELQLQRLSLPVLAENQVIKHLPHPYLTCPVSQECWVSRTKELQTFLGTSLWAAAGGELQRRCLFLAYDRSVGTALSTLLPGQVPQRQAQATMPGLRRYVVSTTQSLLSCTCTYSQTQPGLCERWLLSPVHCWC